MLFYNKTKMRCVSVAMCVTGSIAAALAGCAYDYAPVRVEVRNRASFEPIVGARVTISNTHTINPKAPESVMGITDNVGSITLDVAIYNDLVVRIVPADDPEHVFSAEHPALVGPSSWFGPIRTKGAQTPTVEIRLMSPLTQIPEVE